MKENTYTDSRVLLMHLIQITVGMIIRYVLTIKPSTYVQ